MEERLQKLMAHAGLGSRRACEELIAAGRVTVNGRVAVLGEKADPTRDRILLDGHTIQFQTELVYVALNKPRNVLSTVSAPDPRPTARDLVDLPGHLYPVGRLDVDSEGLLLLTNDGELANRLTHPRYGHEKEYRVLVARRPDEDQLGKWRRGVVMADGYLTAPAQVTIESWFGKGAWLRVILNEGRKRQIREMGALTGLPVVRIVRVRIGSLGLGRLKPREWRLLTPDEIAALKAPPRPPRTPTQEAPVASRRSARNPGPAAAHPELRPTSQDRTHPSRRASQPNGPSARRAAPPGARPAPSASQRNQRSIPRPAEPGDSTLSRPKGRPAAPAVSRKPRSAARPPVPGDSTRPRPKAPPASSGGAARRAPRRSRR